ncbi:MAG: hypothetical protein Ct9H90mP16_14660 [Candidatus Poseidoniales archaeon]|nr:MAG: hypothetical protein Ct9H90mP16_14660 [Candidatus Poseidoniales archaeon]
MNPHLNRSGARIHKCMVRYVGHNLHRFQDMITDQIRTEMFEQGKFMVTKALIDHRPLFSR